MTNKNKNTNELVDLSDDDPTSEFEISGVFRKSDNDFSPEIEVDEPTFSLGEMNPGTNSHAQSDFHSTLNEQKALIEELGYEVELLRSHNRGLEAELEAREEIGRNIAKKAQVSQTDLANAGSALESRDEYIKSTNAALATAENQAARLTDKTNGLQIAAKGFKRKIRMLEERLAGRDKELFALQKELREIRKSSSKPVPDGISDTRESRKLKNELKAAYTELDDLRSYVSGRKNSWDKLNAELSQAREQLDAKTRKTEEISLVADERNAQLIRSREQFIIASKKLSNYKRKVRLLSGKNRELEQSLNLEARAEIAANHARIAEQYGELVTAQQELSVLRQDNARIEQYSDLLRNQLQDQLTKTKASAASNSNLQAELDSANKTIQYISKQLDDEKQLNCDNVNTIDRLHKEFETEVRQIRFELGSAEETIAGQEALNEQLVSNLIDHQGYRRALEDQLNEVEKEHEKTIKSLTVELKQARHKNEDYDRKLSIKDSAIADLIQELSKHTSNIEVIGEADKVLQRIDGFRPKTEESASRENRNRVARLLIGKADGRELRFPLFKERLTIGRTSHNDIQLNLQYISRRHAVISTENGETRVIDWGSKNGVFVNGEQVTEQALQSGDTVSIGLADFKYEERNKS